MTSTQNMCWKLGKNGTAIVKLEAGQKTGVDEDDKNPDINTLC